MSNCAGILLMFSLGLIMLQVKVFSAFINFEHNLKSTAYQIPCYVTLKGQYKAARKVDRERSLS